mgnify:FL=1
MNVPKVFNDLMKMKTYTSLKNHYLILMFYFMVIFITSTVGHTMNKENGFTNGMIIGFIVSLFLWLTYGKHMV